MANNYTQATVLPDLPAAVFSASELDALSACGLSNEESKGMLYFFAQEFFRACGKINRFGGRLGTL